MDNSWAVSTVVNWRAISTLPSFVMETIFPIFSAMSIMLGKMM